MKTKKTNEKNKRKTKKKKSYSSTKTSLFIIATLIGLSIIPGVYHYKRHLTLSSREEQLLNDLKKEEKRKEQLLKDKKYQDSDEYIMDIAQKELNMLKPDQMKIVIEQD